MKKYIIQYKDYNNVLSLLGHEIPHYNISNINTLVVDLTEEEYEALMGANINIIEEQKPKLCYIPDVIPLRGYPDPYNPLNDFLNITPAHSAGFDGTGVTIGIMDTGCNDGGLLACPTLIRQDYTGTYVQDDYNHGGKAINIIGQTHSTIAPNNPISYGGLAHGAQLYSMKVFQDGTEGITPILNAISWAISNDINIINISIDYGGGLTSAINSALAAGIIVVCASGNSSIQPMAHPANIPGVIAVNGVDVSTPTVIFGSYLNNSGENDVTITTYNAGSAESFLGGTSQCAYHVTGLLAIYKQKYPSLDTPKAINLIQRKALEMDGYTYDIDSGLINKLLNYETGGGFLAPLY